MSHRGRTVPSIAAHALAEKRTELAETIATVQDRVSGWCRLHRTRPACGDRRCDRREPFPYPIHVTPVAGRGQVLTEETFVVLGKHLSERGLDFYYSAPLPYRRVITSWECRDGSWLALMLDLTLVPFDASRVV